MAALRALTDQEIGQLLDQDCTCTDWSNVKVVPEFDASTVSRTTLSGTIELGHFDKVVRVWPGVVRPAGIVDARLHNCRVGDHVLIHRVGSCLSNLIIEDEVVIDNVDLIAVTAESSFGNGVRVKAVNEAGGREVPLFDRLSAQLAYLLAFYRDRTGLIAALEAMIERAVEQVRADRGIIGRAARLLNCGILLNCRIGPAAELEQVTRLENGSVNSTPYAPTYVGPGVIARDFVLTDDATVTDGTHLDHCFVGQGAQLQQFSAEHCLFFANCEAYLGEANAVLAGPYTVTHHRASLLIATYTSFMNAGSATNQSNHMYRLGPVHQGILERGCKTGSGSYVCFPAHIGAFSFIKGKHYHHPDTHDLPFSYLIEKDGQTHLYPGAALAGVGLLRDLDKWPQRDRRRSDDLLDQIHFDGLGPTVGQRLQRGLDILEKLDTDHYGNIKISDASRQRGIDLYRAALDLILARLLVERLATYSCSTLDQLHAALQPAVPAACVRWADLAGLYAPLELLDDLLRDIEDGHVNKLKQLQDCLASLHVQYPAWRWDWAVTLWQDRLDKSLEAMNAQDVVETLERGQQAQTLLHRLQRRDAQRDFGSEARIGYGLDGGTEACEQDFTEVRGTTPETLEARPEDFTGWIEKIEALS